MEFKGLKINIVFLVIILIIITFFTGRYILKKYNLEKPLREKLLAVDGVNELILVDNNGKTDLLISLKSNIEFYPLYQEIERIVSKQLGRTQGKIIIQNRVNQDLEDIYYQLHYAIYEGLATNEFIKMKTRITEILKNNYKIKDYRLWVDQQAVYLQLIDGEHCLYQRIPRIDKLVTIKNVEGGIDGG